ncbi:hypothetical protein PtA15_7A792 [Puccinia triticina]|uniref:Uncharacterized protein n=1 Tax=Puccinia triticina TaxID=208348 RepID=A0ABY7CQ53_9BASI|nr:uncharacterized protein PtA15_7A792 [Puccinia triticina]WAQ87063.1 hypothetical protein PtA15_7A792 [Puccinia triticina]WAR56918.1 hypothetical protein PtB15_7B771 [Puccinia triticina]
MSLSNVPTKSLSNVPTKPAALPNVPDRHHSLPIATPPQTPTIHLFDQHPLFLPADPIPDLTPEPH